MATYDTYTVATAVTSGTTLSWSHTADASATGVAVWLAVGSGTSTLPSTVTYGGTAMTFVASAINANGGSRGTIHLYKLSNLQGLALGGTQTVSVTGLPGASSSDPNTGAAVTALSGSASEVLAANAQVAATAFSSNIFDITISATASEFGAAFMFGTMQSDAPTASDGATQLYSVGNLGSANHAAGLLRKAGSLTRLRFANSFTTNLVSAIGAVFADAAPAGSSRPIITTIGRI